MATFKPKLPLIDNLITKKPSDDILFASDVASKIMRFKVLADRETRGFQKVDRDGPKGAYEFEKTAGIFQTRQPYKAEVVGYESEKVNRTPFSVSANMADRISIIDIDSVKVVDTTGMRGIREKRDFIKANGGGGSYKYIELPFVPRELDYSMASKFVGIATLGRNNPYYQFTGSEDTLTFEIDWYSSRLDRKDVITNCRWIEALTKSDSFQTPPHRIMLVWGSDNLLWQDDIWVVTNAPYKLSEFNRGYRAVTNKDKVASGTDARGEFVSTSMLPQQAFQTITLKRVTSLNRSRAEILGKVI